MSSLICGSFAFDTIMGFEGRFADQILPEQLHILNVSFLVPTLKRDFGGCAGNIAYALKILGGDAVPVAALGADGAEYLKRLLDLKISTELVRQIDDSYTAQAMIMTDRDNNQITAFHPGAMSRAHEIKLDKSSVPAGAKIAIISPDGRDAMLQRAQELSALGIDFVFDPGQGLPMFDGNDLLGFIEKSSWITVNDYEGKMLSERTGLGFEQISQKVRGLIVTLGGEGCEVWQSGVKTHVAPEVPKAIVDPTGCGDAWRGALLYGLEKGWDLTKCAKLGNRMGALKIAAKGPQNYTVDSGIFEAL